MARMAGLRVIVSVFVYLFFHVAAQQDSDSPIVLLDDDSFTKNVLEGSEPFLVDFFQEECKPCQQFSPEFKKVANSLKGLIKTGIVDCGKSQQTCLSAGIKGLPAVKLYSWQRLKNPYTGKWYKDEAVDYKGEMRAKKISEFATSHLPGSFVHNISSTTSDAFFALNDKLAKVILFSNKAEVTPLYKAVSLNLRGRILFAQSKSSDKNLCEKFEVDHFPSIFVQTPSGEITKYEGPLRAESIVTFLEPFAIEKPIEGEGEGDGGKGEKRRRERMGEGEKSPEEERKVWVKNITGNQFEAKILTSEDVWVVAFLGNKEAEGCSEKLKEWEDASMSLTGMIHVAEIQLGEDEEAARFATQYKVDSHVKETCLGIVLFPFGDDKSEQFPQIYDGPMAGKELLSFAQLLIPSTFVQILNSRIADAFVETNPRKPKVILFSNKEEVSAMYRTLSTNFRQFISFAQVPSSETEVVEKFEITKVPQIIFLLAQPSRENPSELQMTVNHYQGPLKFPQLSAIFTQMASMAIGLEGEPDTSVDIPELLEDTDFNRYCVQGGKLCVIGLFNGPSKPLDSLRKVASVWANGGQYAFSWIDMERTPGFSTVLGVPRGSIPTVVVISVAKKRIAILQKECEAVRVQEMLEGLLRGRVGTQHLEVLPSFVAARSVVQEEPVKEEEEPIIEEFNLDDILGEDVEGGGVLGTKGERLEEVEKELEREEEMRKAEEEAAKLAEKSAQKKKKKKKKSAKKSGSKDEL